MRKSTSVRFSITLFLLVALLSPTATLANDKKAKKHFQVGMKAEVSEQWDKAAEEFALAVVEDPKNPEYRLHYQRALFNASQMYMKKGTAQANEKDYTGAYLSFRKAYAYDPTNELAKSETERMMRLQRGVENGEPLEERTDANGTVRLIPTGFQKTSSSQDNVVPQRLEKLRDVPFPSGVDLQYLIKELAKDLDLNVLFDKESFRQEGAKVKIELKNVTAAKALDYIFLQEGLFFQKVGPRTILIANQLQRQRFQQLVLRTFYLANADPTEVAKTIQFAIPAQPGRTPTQPLVDKSTNSITVRDTTENIRIIGNLIRSLDKDRAEVVMDVQIYEVSKTDLLQFGNQIGTTASLGNLGGTTGGTIGNNEFGILRSASTIAGTAASIVAQPFGIGLAIPAVNLIALQDKQNTKLIASTQIHAFNNEDSSARIGRRVPVQSAQLLGFNNNPGNNQNNFQNNQAASVITYEQVGLTLKFKPIVFPNQDVQVAMEIESRDVGNLASLTPIFTERTIKGTARVQNNKTLLLASVAQNSESNGRTGLPLLGLIPIIGRFFTAPKRDNQQTDIVIAVTPRVIRAPAILPEDEIERPTGSLQSPTSGSLEALIVQEEIEEQLAAARRIPNVARIQLPDQKVEAPAYVKSNAPLGTENNPSQTRAENQTKTLAPDSIINNLRPIDVTAKTLQITPTANSSESKLNIEETPLKTAEDTPKVNAPTGTENNSSAMTAENQTKTPASDSIINNLRPIDVTAKTLQITPTVDSSENKLNIEETSLKTAEDTPKVPTADLQILPSLAEMKTGERVKLAVMIKSATAFRSAVLGLKFDQSKVAVRSVAFGDVFGGSLVNSSATPFLNQNGKMFVSLSSPKAAAESSSGVLAYIEIEALADGKPVISFDADVLNMLTADGKNFAMKF